MKKVTVRIGEDGTVVVDVNGVVGKGCEKYTEAIKKALSAEVISDDKKPEYYQSDSNKVSAKS